MRVFPSFLLSVASLCTGMASAKTSHPSIPQLSDTLFEFTTEYCYSCHNEDDLKGRLDFDALPLKLDEQAHFNRWVKVHDRLEAGEMPPKEESHRPNDDAVDALLESLKTALHEHDSERVSTAGRAVQRRLNRYEYENALRDIFDAPWLQIKDQLPEDGEVEHFNKVGTALDVSHVHMARYMEAAKHSIRQVLGAQYDYRPAEAVRIYAREQRNLTRSMIPRLRNAFPHRATYPVLGLLTPQPEIRGGGAPFTVGPKDPQLRELEGVGWTASNYVTGFSSRWDSFRFPVVGKYRIRFNGFTQVVGPGGASNFLPDDPRYPAEPDPQYPHFDKLYPGEHDEPITVYTSGGTLNRRLGSFDLTPEPQTHEIGEVWVLPNEMLVTDATRLFRSRPGWVGNPLMSDLGVPAVVFRWMEIEGPITDSPVSKGYQLLFGDLPMKQTTGEQTGLSIPTLGSDNKFEDIFVEIVTKDPRRDAESLLRLFLDRVYPREIEETDVSRFLNLYDERRNAGLSFGEAMVVCYTAVLASPSFVFLDEEPGRLSNEALATRLALFLWNSTPDETLLAEAAEGKLKSKRGLRELVDRMLNHEKASRFREAFLDYWLDLRKIHDSTPSTTLYNDYYLDDALVEAAVDETLLTFDEMLREDLPVSTMVDADFTYLNERLAEHYGIPEVKGALMRRVDLKPTNVRGGLLTQASILKVTANGTTTSPVLRGAWIVERIMGIKIPPPPPVDAVEPDIRGAVTIRQQLEKHSSNQSCASCHQKMDPPGFALESFDVMGGWRDNYRAVDEKKNPVEGIGKNGLYFQYHYGLPVDSAGELPDGREFQDIREFKRLVREEHDLLASNLIDKFIIYGTGAPVRFSDRDEVEQILDRVRDKGYGFRTIIHEVIQSDLFRNK